MADYLITEAMAALWATDYPYPDSGITIKPFPKENTTPRPLDRTEMVNGD